MARRGHVSSADAAVFLAQPIGPEQSASGEGAGSFEISLVKADRVVGNGRCYIRMYGRADDNRLTIRGTEESAEEGVARMYFCATAPAEAPLSRLKTRPASREVRVS